MRIACLCLLVISVPLMSGCGGASPTTPAVSGPPTIKVETKTQRGSNLVKDELPKD